MKVCVLLPKSPLPHKGRVGPEDWQDWYRCSVGAVKTGSDIILVPSSVEIEGIKEASFYEGFLRSLADTKVIVLGGLETVGQLNAVRRWLLRVKPESVVMCVSLLHFPRVWYITKLKKFPAKVNYKVSVGIPRPIEAATDIVLTLMFPMIVLGKGLRRFLKATNRRRKLL